MNEPVIKCPICGQEFLPAEVYLPDYFLGKPTEIIKTTSGKLDFYFGQGMDPDEEFICDNCGAHLKIHANISFNVVAESTDDEEYVTHFNSVKKTQLEEPLFGVND